MIESRFTPWDVVPVIPGYFQIVSARNAGIAFSLFDTTADGRSSPWLIAFTVAVMAGGAYLLAQASRRARPPHATAHWSYPAALALILGGAAGNLYDRLMFGSVTDFLDFYWDRTHFPVFNLADAAITCGALLM